MNRQERILRCLHGLAIGESLGRLAAGLSPDELVFRCRPRVPWKWAAHTDMALATVEVLERDNAIDPQELAAAMVRRYAGGEREYLGDNRDVLEAVANGMRWEDAAVNVDVGGGSQDDGASVRAVPIGAFFGGFPARAADEARQSAVVTHQHTEGQAGAIAAAVAASLQVGGQRVRGSEMLHEVVRYVPRGSMRRLIGDAAVIGGHEVLTAFAHLTRAEGHAAVSMVPIALWLVAHCGDDFPDAVWKGVAGGLAPDTTCALIGGIASVGLARIPLAFQEAVEQLPPQFSLDGPAGAEPAGE